MSFKKEERKGSSWGSRENPGQGKSRVPRPEVCRAHQARLCGLSPRLEACLTAVPLLVPRSLQPLFPGVNELDQISKIHDVIGTPCQKTLTKFKQ